MSLVDYYCNIWARHSHMLAPLTKFTYSKVKFQLTEVAKIISKKIKCIVASSVLFAYPNFSFKNLKSVPMLATYNHDYLVEGKTKQQISIVENQLSIKRGIL